MASRADPRPARRWWGDTLRDAADLALVGIALTVAALPLLTAGAAVATASAAVHERYAEGRWPDLATNARRYARGVLPGIPVTLIGLAFGVLLALDLVAVRTGTVPGGTGLFAVTLLVVVGLLGVAGLAVVEVGRAGGSGWWPAARRAWTTAASHPVKAFATGGVAGLAGLLATLIPITAPILSGYVILALHAVARQATRSTQVPRNTHHRDAG